MSAVVNLEGFQAEVIQWPGFYHDAWEGAGEENGQGVSLEAVAAVQLRGAGWVDVMSVKVGEEKWTNLGYILVVKPLQCGDRMNARIIGDVKTRLWVSYEKDGVGGNEVPLKRQKWRQKEGLILVGKIRVQLWDAQGKSPVETSKSKAIREARNEVHVKAEPRERGSARLPPYPKRSPLS